MTSRFAPVAPVAIHRRLAEEGVLGDYHLLLAHQVLNQPAIHKGFYQHQVPIMSNRSGRRNGKPYIIMDNSLIELGEPLPMDYVLEAAEIVRANVIVMPDILGDRIGTLERTAQSVAELNDIRTSAHPISAFAGKVKVLGVAQGTTFNDVFSCARDMIQALKVDMVSIPRHVTAKVGSRIKLAQEVAKYKKPIHLLGFSDNLFDDFSALSVKGVMGIDSAVPIWYGLQGFQLPLEPPVNADFGRRPHDYEQQQEINRDVIANLRRVERWASIAKGARTER